mgnify:CR=1 FL=1
MQILQEEAEAAQAKGKKGSRWRRDARWEIWSFIVIYTQELRLDGYTRTCRTEIQYR